MLVELNSKSEYRNTKQIQISNHQIDKHRCPQAGLVWSVLRIWYLDIRYCFGFSASDLGPRVRYFNIKLRCRITDYQRLPLSNPLKLIRHRQPPACSVAGTDQSLGFGRISGLEGLGVPLDSFTQSDGQIAEEDHFGERA